MITRRSTPTRHRFPPGSRGSPGTKEYDPRVPFDEIAGVQVSLPPNPSAAGSRRLPLAEQTLTELVLAAGDDFLARLVIALREAFDLDYALVGEVSGPHRDHVATLAVATREGLAPGFSYLIRGAPCEKVAAGSVCVIPRNLLGDFPEACLAKELSIESYVGVPLSDPFRRPLGLLGAFSCRPRDDTSAILATLQAFAPRVSRELCERRGLEELERIVEATAAPTGGDVFRALARTLAEIMQVRTGFVTEFVAGETMRCRVLAVSIAGEERPDLDGMEFEMLGTPCAMCAEHSTVFHPSGFLRSYPDKAELYAPFGTEAYMGLVYRDHEGRALGHVGIVHDEPLRDGLSPQALLHVFATKAAAEFVRRRAEAERIAAERRLADAQRVESVGLLAGGIAHDFNNLLVGVLGNASLGSRAAASAPEMRGYFAEIELAATRAADLASQLLAYSGKGRFVVRSVDLNQVVAETEALLRVTVPKNVELRIVLDPSPLRVRGDVTQLRQVLMNLLMNAVESIGAAAGVVRLSTGVQEVGRAALESLAVGGELAPGIHAFVEVADTGCGMDSATRVRIFEPFFTTKFTGRGLGLAAVQGIVLGHGGGLMISSEPGCGTTMRLFLPLGAVTETIQAAPIRPGSQVRGKGLVLVAEDDALVRTTAVRMLERLGFDTLEAGDGESAFELLRAHRSELAVILLDVTMPCREGSESVRTLAELAPEVPVLITSGYGERAVDPRDAEVPRAGFLAKPFRLEDLRARLVEVLGR